MSVADLTSRIDGARGGHQRATELLAEIRSGSEPAEVPPPPENDGGMSGSDIGHAILEVFGYVPIIGTVTNLANAVWYAAEEDYENAALSVVSAVPIVGPVAKVVRRGVIAAQAVTDAYRAGTENEESEPGIPAPRSIDPVPVAGARVPGLPTSHYGESRDQTPTNPSNVTAREYEARVTRNTTGLVIFLDNPDSGLSDKDNPIRGMKDTEFDGVEYGPNGRITLLDAKYAGDSGYYANYPQGSVDQAQRQIAAMANSGIASANIRIEWRVSTEAAEQALRRTFRAQNIDIDVEYVP